MSETNVIGVLGLSEGISILTAVQSSELWRVGMLCDLDEQLCRQRSEAFGDPPWTTDYARMLDEPGIDTVAIFTPNSLHAEHIRMAMEAGKDVICTKPLIDRLSDGITLLETAERTGRRLLVGQSSRFMAALMRQRADFEQQRFGRLLSVEAHYHGDKRDSIANTWKSDWLYTGLVHPIDLVTWYLGPIDAVAAVGVHGEGGPADRVPENLHVLLRNADGAVGVASGCYGTPYPIPEAQDVVECTLRGTSGVSHATFGELKYYRRIDGEDDIVFSDEKQRDYYFRFQGQRHHVGEFQNYLEYFARCRAAGQIALPDLREGLRTVAVLEAVRQSLKDGCFVCVSDVLRAAGLESLT